MEVGRFVDDEIAKWWVNLVDRINNIKESGRTPVLVALSRKMPRLLEWIRYAFLPKHPDLPVWDEISDCELTTELALPFRVAACRDFDRVTYVVIDDILIHGETLREITTCLNHMAELDEQRLVCYVSCIFIYQRPVGLPDSVNVDDLRMLSLIQLSALKEVISYLAEKVRSFSLPLDLEFPILRLNLAEHSSINPDTVIDEVYHHFQSLNSELSYKGNWGNTATLLSDDNSNVKEKDFAKTRCFLSARSLSFEIYSPHRVSEPLKPVNDNIWFGDKLYCNLWQSIINPVREYVRETKITVRTPEGDTLFKALDRSATVMVNYLLSLSFLAETAQRNISENLLSLLSLRLEDLALLLGARRSGELFDFISVLYNMRHINTPMRRNNSEYVISFGPAILQQDYELKIANAVVESDRVEDVMSAIFAFQNFAAPHYQDPEYRYNRFHFGETYESLLRHCGIFYQDKLVDIHRWMDNQIDNGAIIPRYEPVVGKVLSWGRFFHAGLNQTSH